MCITFIRTYALKAADNIDDDRSVYVVSLSTTPYNLLNALLAISGWMATTAGEPLLLWHSKVNKSLISNSIRCISTRTVAL